MADKYLSLKLTITELPTNSGSPPRYRSRIEQSPLGASDGPGCDFDLDKSAPLSGISVTDFQSQMAGGNFSNREQILSFGRELFRRVFQNEVRDRFLQCVTRAQSSQARLRIALNIQPAELIDIPWEYLHDGGSFLLKQGCSIVRVIDSLGVGEAPFGPIRRLLVAVANPKDPDFNQFEASGHIAELKKALRTDSPVEIRILHPATRDQTRKDLTESEFDAFYFLGHGNYSESTSGQLYFEDGNGYADAADADEVAGWLRQAQSVRFAYLNSCSTVNTAISNRFAGVAQRLMRDGDVAAVVAMQTSVVQTSAMKIAIAFFNHLRRGMSPEEAAVNARGQANDLFSWGVPVVYTYLAGPESFDRNRIACLLSAQPGVSKYACKLATWKRGYLEEDAPELTAPPKEYMYPGPTFAKTDILAASYVGQLISRIASPADISITGLDKNAKPEESHVFAFGSRSNEFATSIVSNFSKTFDFSFPEGTGEWILTDLEMDKREYRVKDPSKLTAKEYRASNDYGIIQKIKCSNPKLTFFIIAGLGDRATEGCGWYFLQNWESLLAEFGAREFGIIVEFPQHAELFGQRINRKTGKPM